MRGKDSKGRWREPFDPYAMGAGPFLDNDYYGDYYYMPDYGQELMTPVFGILNGGEAPEKGMMAIIEGGAETANLHCTLASTSGSGANRDNATGIAQSRRNRNARFHLHLSGR